MNLMQDEVMLRSVQFRRDHEILYHAPIVRGQGWIMDADADMRPVGQADVLDLDGDGQAGTRMGAAGGALQLSYKEPSLQVPLSRLADYAAGRGTEVLTQDDFSDLNIQNVSVRQNEGVRSGEIRSLATLVAEKAPFEPGARWAIDVASQEFLIYR